MRYLLIIILSALATSAKAEFLASPQPDPLEINLVCEASVTVKPDDRNPVRSVAITGRWANEKADAVASVEITFTNAERRHLQTIGSIYHPPDLKDGRY
jgi:hypothetical protein